MPVLDQLIAWTLYAQNRYTPDYQVEFEPLSVPSEKEVTETRLAQAKIHEIYVNMQALDPSEVRRELGSDVAEVDGNVEIDMGEDDGAEAK